MEKAGNRISKGDEIFSSASPQDKSHAQEFDSIANENCFSYRQAELEFANFVDLLNKAVANGTAVWSPLAGIAHLGRGITTGDIA